MGYPWDDTIYCAFLKFWTIYITICDFKHISNIHVHKIGFMSKWILPFTLALFIVKCERDPNLDTRLTFTLTGSCKFTRTWMSLFYFFKHVKDVNWLQVIMSVSTQGLAPGLEIHVSTIQHESRLKKTLSCKLEKSSRFSFP